MMRVIEASAQHCSMLGQLYKGFIEEHYAYDKEYYCLVENAAEKFSEYVGQNMVGNSAKVIFVAEDATTNVVVGYVSGWVEQRSPLYTQRDYGYLSNLFVKKEYRGQGVGRQLTEKMIAWFKQQNIARIEINIDVRNEGLLRVWETYGFKEFGKKMALAIDPVIEVVNLKGQYAKIKQEIDEVVHRVVKKQHFILGEELVNFEKEFAAFCGAAYAVGVNSGTDALMLALKSRGIKEGDEVITVPNTAIPTVVAIRETGATPVFADIDEKNFTMDVESLKNKITPRTKAIIPVHLYGESCDLDEINAIAKKHDLFVVEDACQAHGALYKNKSVGTHGDFGCFSFYPSKNLGAYGDGGLILCQREEDYLHLKQLRNYGQSSRYVCDQEGKNSRLDELQAAILRVKLKHLPAWNEQRIKNAQLYREQIHNPDVILPSASLNSNHVFHLFVVRHQRRDALKKQLEEKGIKTEIHYPLPVYLQKGYEFLGLKEGACPVAEKVMKEILSLPMYPELRESQIKYIAEQINMFK